MKFTIERAALLKLLGNVSRVVEKRNTIPILANVWLNAVGSRLTLCATDLDMEATGSVAAEVSAAGRTTVNANLFHDIVRKLPDGSQILVEQKETMVAVRAGRSRFTLQTLPDSDFPIFESKEAKNEFDLDVQSVRELFSRPQFAISTEETRYYLNGIYLHVASDMLTAVATDGHRLARVQLPAPDGAKGMPGVIVPRKMVTEVARLAEGPTHVTLFEGKIGFDFGGIRLVAKLIDGTFPDYSRVIPVGNNTVGELDTDNFAAAAERVAVVSNERGRAVKMSWSDGKVVAEVVSPDSGSAIEEVDAEFSGAPLQIGFNSRYLADILAQVKGDKVRLEMSDPGSPTVIRSLDDNAALFVLMPMRV